MQIASDEGEIIGHDRGPDVGLEVVEPAPGAAGQTISPLQAGDTGLDAGTEIAELAIDPAALDHVFDPEAAMSRTPRALASLRLAPLA
jgi:hypothetical protein